MMLIMQNFESKPKMSCSTITDVVMTIGFLTRPEKSLHILVKSPDSMTRPEKSLHFLVKSPDSNLHFLVSPEIALHLITG